MNKVRAKFKVDTITKSLGQKCTSKEGGGYDCVDREMSTVKLSPVYANNDPEHENSKFWEATPGGTFEMNMVYADAVSMFELGKEYYIDVIPAD